MYLWQSRPTCSGGPGIRKRDCKGAHGLADDMLTTTLLACQCPKIFAPAMNTRMYQNPVVQDTRHWYGAIDSSESKKAGVRSTARSSWQRSAAMHLANAIRRWSIPGSTNQLPCTTL